MIKDQKIKEFISDLSSSSPTPGGGATAALCGAFSASLAEMVCNLTIGKKGYEEVENKMKEIKESVVKEKEKLLLLADEDVKAFDEVMKAYKIKTKDREQKIQKTLKYATLVPLEVAQLSSKISNYSNILIGKGNKNALSDAKSAKYLALAAIKSANENIDINLRYLKDERFISKIKKARSKV